MAFGPLLRLLPQYLSEIGLLFGLGRVTPETNLGETLLRRHYRHAQYFGDWMNTLVKGSMMLFMGEPPDGSRKQLLFDPA